QATLIANGFGHHNVRLSDWWASCSSNAEIAVGPLSAHPQGQLSNLSAARVNIHTVQILREDEPWHCALQFFESWIVLSQSLARCFALGALKIVMGFFVNGEEQVERVE